ncbi:MAG: hypothetical protein WAW85_07040, partial [Gordonia sp. (in: high G+C Gram-positive bacteria)]
MTATSGSGYRYTAAAVVAITIAALVTASAVPVTGGRAVGGGGFAPGTVTVLADDGVPDEVLVSRVLLESSSAAIVVRAEARPEDQQRALDLSRNHRVPVFVVAHEQVGVVGQELRRLNAATVVSIGGEVPGLPQAQTPDGMPLGPGVAPAAGRPVVLV